MSVEQGKKKSGDLQAQWCPMMIDDVRLSVIIALIDGSIDVAEAATTLQKSVRQIYRMKARAQKAGIGSLAHGNRGRAPANKISAEVWEKVLALARSEYIGLSYHELKDVLAREHRILIGRESLRKQLRAAGISMKKHFSKGA